MRRAAKIDANQHEIVEMFRRLGYSVLLLHTVGRGCPDILIGKHGRSYLIEIKDGSKPPSARKLTEDEKKFHDLWRGGLFIIESADQALELAMQLDGHWEDKWDMND